MLRANLDNFTASSTRQCGFSMVELIVVVVIVAALAAFAIPSFRSVMISNTNRTIANQLFLDLNLAKGEAVRRGSTVGVVAVNSTDWSGGWTVKQGTLTGTPSTFDTGTSLAIVSRDSLSADYLLAGATALPSYVVFNATGNLASSNSAITFLICHKGDSASRTQQITIQPSGSVISTSINDSSTQTSC